MRSSFVSDGSDLYVWYNRWLARDRTVRTVVVASDDDDTARYVVPSVSRFRRAFVAGRLGTLRAAVGRWFRSTIARSSRTRHRTALVVLGVGYHNMAVVVRHTDARAWIFNSARHYFDMPPWLPDVVRAALPGGATVTVFDRSYQRRGDTFCLVWALWFLRRVVASNGAVAVPPARMPRGYAWEFVRNLLRRAPCAAAFEAHLQRSEHVGRRDRRAPTAAEARAARCAITEATLETHADWVRCFRRRYPRGFPPLP